MENKKIFGGYSSSLVSQDITEGDGQFHGYLLWNLDSMSCEEISVENYHSYHNVKITPYIDFDDLDFDIDDATKEMHVRFIWCTLPQTRNNENERKLSQYLKSKYKNVIILHKNEFIESEKIEVNKNITLENVSDKSIQHEIFREFLEKIGTDKKLIEDVIALDEEVLNEIDLSDEIGGEWSVIKFGGNNFMSYEQLDIDWRDMDGLFQITGINTAGKTTIMKLLSYLLYNKAPETDFRQKYGDSRFVNNRNGALSCDTYLVIESNGEYYGIKKKTEISKDKNGDVDGASTTLNYYILSNPDEEMNDNTSLEKLDEDKRIKTQKKLTSIIGTYDNFMRIVMTTSDSLNKILSNDMSTFIDSILFDSGLDIFDKKMDGWKIINRRNNEKIRVACNVEAKTNEIENLQQDIKILEENINQIENVKLPDIQNRILTGRTYVETLTKKLFKIDPEIYDLKVDNVNYDISVHRNKIIELNARKSILNESIEPLKSFYDDKRLNELIQKKDIHRNNEYQEKLKIKAIEQEIRDIEHKIEIINGEIFRLKQDGTKFKKEIGELKESKICPTCGQPLTEEHQHNIDDVIKLKETEMFKIAKIIKDKEIEIDLTHKASIVLKQKDIAIVNENIQTAALEMETVLIEIGELTNDKNDVEKRKELQNELDQIPTKIQNEELKIDILQKKIDNYDNSLKQIEENKNIEKGIKAAKDKILVLESEESEEKENVFINKTNVGNKQQTIKYNERLIIDFKEQEYQDTVMNLYKKCVHRDGIPRQMLGNYILPKINATLENILSVAQFKVWLDPDTFRPKLMYYSRPKSIIDCISASGKERTFSSVVLKFALNQINVKAKPTIFLLDEVMGKLDLAGSVDEFIEILQLIKNGMKKVLIVEQVHEVNPDYLINVELDENGISSLIIE
jgi:DNA repair exonuclease SbcCD ATPase subunit